MRLDKKVTFIRARLRWLAMDMDNWANLMVLSLKDDKYKEYKCSAEEILLKFKERLLQELGRMDDPDACPSSCKRMYFCELKNHHGGKHLEGGLGWSDDESDDGK